MGPDLELPASSHHTVTWKLSCCMLGIDYCEWQHTFRHDIYLHPLACIERAAIGISDLLRKWLLFPFYRGVRRWPGHYPVCGDPHPYNCALRRDFGSARLRKL